MNTWTFSIQNSNSPVLDIMTFFHDFTMTVLTFIIILISYSMASAISNYLVNRFLLQGHTIELLWTILPMLILIAIAIPSIKTLYLSDDIQTPQLTMKSIGHQWYWSYEYSDFNKIEFDSFMIPPSQLQKNQFRLLDTDNRCILPHSTHVRLITTSTDVIHSWTVPSLGVKLDSSPGRLNQSSLFMFRPGLFFGQCSEICGTNHSFMPIAIESTSPAIFTKWLSSMS